jgi:hypothetical protein
MSILIYFNLRKVLRIIDPLRKLQAEDEQVIQPPTKRMTLEEVEISDEKSASNDEIINDELVNDFVSAVKTSEAEKEVAKREQKKTKRLTKTPQEQPKIAEEAVEPEVKIDTTQLAE